MNNAITPGTVGPGVFVALTLPAFLAALALTPCTYALARLDFVGKRIVDALVVLALSRWRWAAAGLKRVTVGKTVQVGINPSGVEDQALGQDDVPPSVDGGCRTIPGRVMGQMDLAPHNAIRIELDRSGGLTLEVDVQRSGTAETHGAQISKGVPVVTTIRHRSVVVFL